MTNILIGNAICFLGSIIMVLIGFIKERKKFLLAQGGMNAFFIVGNLFLNGISGAIANACTMLRNIVCLKFKMNVPIKLFFIGLQVALTFCFGADSIIMWLPILGAGVFTWYMDTDNMTLLKAVTIGGQLCWLIYDIYILNFATVPFDIAACITNTIALVAIIRNGKIETDEKNNTDS